MDISTQEADWGVLWRWHVWESEWMQDGAEEEAELQGSCNGREGKQFSQPSYRSVPGWVSKLNWQRWINRRTAYKFTYDTFCVIPQHSRGNKDTKNRTTYFMLNWIMSAQSWRNMGVWGDWKLGEFSKACQDCSGGLFVFRDKDAPFLWVWWEPLLGSFLWCVSGKKGEVGGD